jgi:hypothetical protein
MAFEDVAVEQAKVILETNLTRHISKPVAEDDLPSERFDDDLSIQMDAAHGAEDHLKDVHQKRPNEAAHGHHQIKHLAVAQSQLFVSCFHFGQP